MKTNHHLEQTETKDGHEIQQKNIRGENHRRAKSGNEPTQY